MAKKYMLNPERAQNRTRCNGITITSDDVMEGDEWHEGTKQHFPHLPPVLVEAPADAVVTIRLDDPPAAPQHPSIEAVAERSGVVPVSEPDPEPDPEPEEEPEAPEEPAEEEPEYPEEEEEAWELTDIKGVGGKRAESLADAGYQDVETVACADPQELMKDMRDLGKSLNLATARSIVKGAKALLED